MSARPAQPNGNNASPDPTSHALDAYDDLDGENLWIDSEDNDDMDFDPETDETDDNNIFALSESVEENSEGSYAAPDIINHAFVPANPKLRSRRHRSFDKRGRD